MTYRRGGTSYGSAVGRVRVKERMLFNKDYLFSLAEAKNAAEAMEMLAKTNYAKYFATVPDKLDHEKIIAAKWSAVKKLYRRILEDEGIMNFLWSRHDLYNAKILLKSGYLSVEPEELSDIGTVDQERLVKYILNNERTSIPAWLVEGISSARKKFEFSKDPKMIDIVLDKAHIQFLKEMVKSAENGFLKDLLRVEVDLYNIRTFVRLKAAKKEDGFLAEVLVQGGSKAKSFYAGLAGASDEEVISAFKDTPYGRVVREGLVEHASSGSFWKLEKLSADHVLMFAKKIKHSVFGFEPLIGYVIARRNEATALRTIMEGKLAEMPADFIKERIPEVYV